MTKGRCEVVKKRPEVTKKRCEIKKVLFARLYLGKRNKISGRFSLIIKQFK
jgi:hypothetical protein